MEPEFPFEFVVTSTPRSLGSSAASREAWKQQVREASKALLPEGYCLTEKPISVTLYYFPAEAMEGDIDNIVKPILDSSTKHIYFDDYQVERIVVQKFEQESPFSFEDPSDQLAEAIASARPKLYIKLSTDPFEELR